MDDIVPKVVEYTDAIEDKQENGDDRTQYQAEYPEQLQTDKQGYQCEEWTDTYIGGDQFGFQRLANDQDDHIQDGDAQTEAKVAGQHQIGDPGYHHGAHPEVGEEVESTGDQGQGEGILHSQQTESDPDDNPGDADQCQLSTKEPKQGFFEIPDHQVTRLADPSRDQGEKSSLETRPIDPDEEGGENNEDKNRRIIREIS